MIGLATFVIIGVFHPVVTKAEYHVGKRVWPLFLVAGIACCAASLFVGNAVASPLLAVLGFTFFWSIRERYAQEERVRKGWYPANPKRRQP
jgi:hypothetical protein